MIQASDILTDADVAQLAGMALDTFQKRMSRGIPPGELDWAQARPVRVGNRRRWLRQDVENVITKRIIKK